MGDTSTMFGGRRLTIVLAPQWFTRCERTAAGAGALDYYLGAVDDAGEVTVIRGVASDKLAAERAMVARHNAKLAAGAVGLGEPVSLAAARQPAAIKRGGPGTLFTGGKP